MYFFQTSGGALVVRRHFLDSLKQQAWSKHILWICYCRQFQVTTNYIVLLFIESEVLIIFYHALSHKYFAGVSASCFCESSVSYNFYHCVEQGSLVLGSLDKHRCQSAMFRRPRAFNFKDDFARGGHNCIYI